MAFQLKDFTSISASLVNYARATQDQITDFSIGSVARTIMESAAIEIDEFYQRVFAGLMESIPVAIFRGFSFDIIEAKLATGYVNVTFAAPLGANLTIPAGTKFTAPGSGVSYVSMLDMVVPAGAPSVKIYVSCTEVGSVGNCGANAISLVVGFGFPAGSVIGNDPITSGADEENEEDRKARFAAWIDSIGRGTVNAVEYGAASAKIFNSIGQPLEYVAKVGFSEVPGRFFLYIYGSNGLASDALVAQAQRIVDGYRDEDGNPVPGYRAAGIEAVVSKMSERSVPIALNVEMLLGYDLDTDTVNRLRTAVSGELSQVDPGGVLLMARITDAALSVPGVRRAFVSNTENEVCGEHEVLVLGEFDVEPATGAQDA